MDIRHTCRNALISGEAFTGFYISLLIKGRLSFNFKSGYYCQILLGGGTGGIALQKLEKPKSLGRNHAFVIKNPISVYIFLMK